MFVTSVFRTQCTKTFLTECIVAHPHKFWGYVSAPDSVQCPLLFIFKCSDAILLMAIVYWRRWQFYTCSEKQCWADIYASSVLLRPSICCLSIISLHQT